MNWKTGIGACVFLLICATALLFGWWLASKGY